MLRCDKREELFWPQAHSGYIPIPGLVLGKTIAQGWVAGKGLALGGRQISSFLGHVQSQRLPLLLKKWGPGLASLTDVSYPVLSPGRADELPGVRAAGCWESTCVLAIPQGRAALAV